jgi:Enolase, C-terminal TIM barrel domain
MMLVISSLLDWSLCTYYCAYYYSSTDHHLSLKKQSHKAEYKLICLYSTPSKIGVELLMEAIKKSGYEKEVKIGMDVAASEFLLPSGEHRC